MTAINHRTIAAEVTDAEILAQPPTTTVLSPHVRNAVAAMLATSHGYDSEVLVTPENIEWATTYGGTLHIIEHDDGSVTFTKEHRDECPFITTAGTRTATTSATSRTRPT